MPKLSIDVLNHHLWMALKHLKESTNPNKGVVTAALVDTSKVVYATSEKTANGIWLHAERHALQHYLARYGRPSLDAVMVVSLSPCVHPSDFRKGMSCSHLLTGKDPLYLNGDLTKVHVGLIDSLQADAARYQRLGFYLTRTSEPNLQQACEALFDYFKPAHYGVVPIAEFIDQALVNI